MRTRFLDHIRDEHGSAMMVAIIVAILIMLFGVLVTNIAVFNYINSARYVREEQVRGHAEAALDEMYSNVNRDVTYLTHGIETHPGYDPPGTPTANWKWAKVDNGTVSECDDLYTNPTRVCYHVTAISDGPEATVEVTARGYCRTDNVATCHSTRYQQRLQRVSYFDFLYLTDREVIDPRLHPSYDPDIHDACDTKKWGDDNIPGTSDDRPPICYEPAYLKDRDFVYIPPTEPWFVPRWADDQVNAPIHTNDHVIQVCGDINFASNVQTVGGSLPGSGSSKVWVPERECVANPTFALGDGNVHAPVLALPTAEDIERRLAPIAKANGHHFTGETTIYLSASGFGTTGRLYIWKSDGSYVESARYPDGGVVYVDGDVNVSGLVKGQLTIAASGDIHIKDQWGNGSSIRYDSAPTNLADLDAEITDSLGLITAQDVNIYWDDFDPQECDVVEGASSIPATPYQDLVTGQSIRATPFNAIAGSYSAPAAPMATGGVQRSLHAAVVARNFHFPDWQCAFHGGDPGVMTFFGTIATRYRGAFGGYDRNTGNLVSGFQKDFYFDSKLHTRQPPYLVDTLASSWQRHDIREVPPNAPGLGNS